MQLFKYLNKENNRKQNNEMIPQQRNLYLE